MDWWFGLPPIEGQTTWGARAIDDGKTFGLLPDRQSWAGGTDEDKRALGGKINAALPAAQKMYGKLKGAYVFPSNEPENLFKRDGLCIECRCYGGYAYLRAYELTEVSNG